MSPRKLWVRRVGLVALVALLGWQAWRHGHDYVFADKFQEIEPGRVFRGAWQHDWPMRRIIRDRKIKTIVALAHPADNPLAVAEKRLADETGVRWVHIPIVDNRATADTPGIDDQLKMAADVIADPANQPVYFHCHHGVNRASMAQIAYRTLHCGWTLEQAEAEVADAFGLVTVSKGPDYRRMAHFYRTKVLPSRAAGAQAQAQAQADAGATRR